MPTTTRIGAQKNPSLIRPTDLGTGVHTTIGYRIMLEACQAIIKTLGWDALDAICAAIRTRYTALAVAPSVLSSVLPSVDNVVNPKVGRALHVITHQYDGLPAPVITFQWQRNASTNIAGATNRDYIPQVADIGAPLKCVVTNTNGVGSPLVETTAPTAPVLA